MRPVTTTVVGAAGIVNGAPVVVDQYLNPFELGLMFEYSGATTTFDIQFTMDDPFSFADATDFNTNGTWFDLTGSTAMVANAQTVLKTPVRAVRLQANAGAGGTGVLTVVQSGIAR